MPSSILPSHQKIRENDHDPILTPFLTNNQAFGHEKSTSVDLTHSRRSHTLTDYVVRVCSSTISFAYLFENLEHDFRKFCFRGRKVKGRARITPQCLLWTPFLGQICITCYPPNCSTFDWSSCSTWGIIHPLARDVQSFEGNTTLLARKGLKRKEKKSERSDTSCSSSKGKKSRDPK